MVSKVLPQRSQTKFKVGDFISNWSIGDDDSQFEVMGKKGGKYLLKVIQSSFLEHLSQHWADFDEIDMKFDNLIDVTLWKKELDL